MNGQACHDESTLTWQAQIGSLQWPETACSSIPETMSLLRQAVAIHDESIRTVNLTSQGFQTNAFVIGIPLQNVPGAAFSGINTRSGDLITIRAKNMSNDNTVNGAGKCFVTMISEQIIEIREGSCTVLD